MRVFQKMLNLLVLLSLAVFSNSIAHAEILISPTRAIVTMDEKNTTLTLRNTSDGARTYRLFWEDKRISQSTGRYEPVQASEDWPSAKDMIRFSPRQISVGAGENQTVRLSFRPPSDIKTGEYRSHLRLQVVGKDSDPSAVFKMDHPNNDGVNFELFMQMSFSVPVIARVGLQPPEVSISKVQVMPAEEGQRMGLNVTLDRHGLASSFGDLVVEMQQSSDSVVELIGKLEDVHIFPEISSKTVRIPIKDRPIPPGSWIRVAYEGEAEYDGTLWAERVFQSN